ncbi:Wzy polymerase domain-containing protein [Klebsiella aerogenes]|uniref:PglL family O-oligosaccharyltransferase n=1 Tax=Klebsiella aerogenes TaxID=548 RepID=UPI0022EC613C|nr:O-antigen ligase family protein [Klebsiella aerogenes]ELA1888009.1 O-antigen ligase C-terminal domain-containing protein [Klebsiella aerogenes]MDA3990636.1 Wzy polymerase domain-containing protein [Klebsiella aerogenes]MDF0548024.1 Wzy polymerase domain-containing protein [Klebsiella aerogenes]
MNRTTYITTERQKLRIASLIMVSGLAGYFIIFLHIAWLNNGGTGAELPYNLLAWSVTSLICAAFWVIRPATLKPVLSSLTFSLFLGGILMSLPLLWSPSPAAFSNALPRTGGLWAGMMFFLTLQQTPLTENHKTVLLHSLVWAGVAEALIVLSELYAPATWLPSIWQQLAAKYGRYGTGVFQQVNVTASFLSVTLAVSLFMLASGKVSALNDKAPGIQRIFFGSAIILLSSVLTLLYSRIGWLGGVVSVGGTWFILTFTRFRVGRHSQLLVLVLPAAGFIVGCNLMHFSIGEALDAHAGSNNQRLLTLTQTLIYTAKHPFFGYGAGTYEGYYQHFMARFLHANPSRELMDHPHNELLYQYAEGGVIALAGVLIWCMLYIRLWLRARTVIQIAALLAMLPLLLHTQVEYPLYYSVPHWITLLILLRLAEGEKDSKPVQFIGEHGSLSITLLFVLASLYGLAISLQATYNSTVMSRLESNDVTAAKDIPDLHVSWVQRFRYEQDLNLSRLIDFQQVHNTEYLRDFIRENEKIISVHPAPELYNNQIAVLNYLHEYNKANEWLLQAQYTLPWETQFRQ